MRVFAFCVAVIVLWTTPAWAGMKTKHSCLDHYSKQVSVVKSRTGKSVEAAYTQRGLPILRVNFHALVKLKPSVLLQEYMYFHECARHVLGHVVTAPRTEYEYDQQINRADCWAANRLYYYEHGVEPVSQVQEMINSLSREQWVHFPGPVRKVDFKEDCYFR